MKNFKQMFLLLFLSVMWGVNAVNAATVSIPQELGTYIDWNNAALSNCNVENGGKNIGSTRANTVATFTLSNQTAQEYFMTMKTGASGLTAVLTITVKDGDNQVFSKDINVENTGSWTPSTLHNLSLGTLPASEALTLEIKVKSTTGKYAGNYGDLALYALSQYDQMPSTNNVTLKNGTHTGARYESDKDDIGSIKNGSSSVYTIYNTQDAYVDMKMDVMYFKNAGQVRVTVSDALTARTETTQTFDITANGKGLVFSLTDPLLKGLKTIRMDYITSSSGYIMNYKNLQFNKRADYVPSSTLTARDVTIDGMEVPAELLEAIKENGSNYTLQGNIYTVVPTVSVTMSDMSQATVTSSVGTNSVTYTIRATGYEATLIVEGLHLYAKADGENVVDLKYTGEGKYGTGSWTNGLYTLTGAGLDGWNNSSFKLNASEYTLKVPSNVKVKQLVFKDLGNNYDDDASITAVTSGEATVYLPTKRYALKGKNYDMIVNIEGHEWGAPISISINNQGQPTAWLQLITEENANMPQQVEVSAAGYATFVALSNVVVPSTNDVTVYTAKLSDDAASLKLEAVAGGTVLGRGEGFIVKAAAGTYPFARTTDAAATLNNDLKGATANVSVGETDVIYVLAKPEASAVGFYRVNKDTKVVAGKAYIKVSAGEQSAAPMLVFEDAATGIQEVKTAAVNTATAHYYTLQGVKVSGNTRGLLLHNGKKYMVK